MDLTKIVRTVRFKGGKSGRRDVGRIHHLAGGQKLYLAKLKRDDIFCGDAKGVSEAIRDGKAEWGIDDDALLRLRIETVKFVGVCENDTGDIWLAPIESWFNPENYKYRRDTRRGPPIRFLAFRHFKTLHGVRALTTRMIDKR